MEALNTDIKNKRDLETCINDQTSEDETKRVKHGRGGNAKPLWLPTVWQKEYSQRELLLNGQPSEIHKSILAEASQDGFIFDQVSEKLTQHEKQVIVSEISNPQSLSDSNNGVTSQTSNPQVLIQYASDETEYLKSKEHEEVLLKPDLNRFILFPVKYKEIFHFYELAQNTVWKTAEVDLDQDLKDWEKIDPSLKEYIINVLAFFNTADGIVNENLVVNFLREVQIAEARQVYSWQMAIEAVHTETYGTIITTLIRDETQLKRIMTAHQSIAPVKLKADWAMKYLGGITTREDGSMVDFKASFAERLVAFACVEGLFFTSAFVSIFFLKLKNLMPGLTFSNELISRDENLHFQFAVLLFSMLEYKCSAEVILKIVQDAVRIEKEFVNYSLPKPILGFNAKLLCQWVEFMGDHVLTSFGCESHYNTANPFPWMDTISLTGKTNFFEKRVSDYQKSSTVSKYSASAKF
jgi:ribonucleotide reductase beta subunit family protein with ferritin-like domain